MFRLEEDSNDGEGGKLAFTGGVVSVQLGHGLKDLPDVPFVGGVLSKITLTIFMHEPPDPDPPCLK